MRWACSPNSLGYPNVFLTKFRDPGGRSVKVVVPLLKAMLLSFFQSFPRSLSYAQLEVNIRRQLDSKIVLTDNDFRTMGDVLIRFMLDGIVRLHVEPGPVFGPENSKPLAFSPARHGAEKEAKVVPNLRHENIGLTQIDARVLSLLDGSRPVDQLAAELLERAMKKEFTLMRDNIQLSDPQEIRPIIEKLLAECLQKFEKLALLVH